jgi:hypothetical protein
MKEKPMSSIRLPKRRKLNSCIPVPQSIERRFLKAHYKFFSEFDVTKAVRKGRPRYFDRLRHNGAVAIGDQDRLYFQKEKVFTSDYLFSCENVDLRFVFKDTKKLDDFDRGAYVPWPIITV